MSASKKSGTKAFVLVASKIITLLLSMLTAIVLARTLTLTEYGTYSELLTVSSIGVSIFSLGLPNALNYFLPKADSKDEKNRFIAFYFAIVTFLSLVLMGVMAFANRAISDYYDNKQLITYSYFLIIIPWTKLLISSRSNLLIAEGKVLREIIYCLANGFTLALTGLLTLTDYANFQIYIILYVIVECVFAALVYLEAFIASNKKITVSINRTKISELIKYTVPLGLSTAISTISLDLDKLIIGNLMDEASVAIYANAGKELPFSLISTAFTAVFLPQMVALVKKNKISSAINRWKDIMVINYILLSFCVSASIVFAPQIISLLYSPAYLEGLTIFRIYSLTLILRITYWAMILNAFGKMREILLNSVICLLINAVSSVLLYKAIGFAGPALATLLGILAIVIFQIVRTSKLVNMPIGQIIPFREFLLPSLVSVASGLGIFAIVSYMELGVDTKGIVSAILMGLAWGVIYLIIFARKIKRLWQKLNVDILESDTKEGK